MINCETQGASEAVARRYLRDMGVAAALYMASVVAGALIITQLHPPHWVRIALALAPLAPVAMILRAILVLINSVDELQRRIHLEAVLITAGLTAFGTFAWGFLEEWAGFPRLTAMWILPAMMVLWGLTLALVRRRYA